jgi:outer membrane lipoprotein-sorting protein
VEELVRGLQRPADAEMHHRVLTSLLDTLKQRQRQSAAGIQPTLRRIVMKSPVTKLAVAAAVVLAVLLPASFFLKSTSSASAAQVFYQAAAAMGKLKSFHIRVDMRTHPGDNFALIDLNHDFVPIDFWKQATDDEWGQWRLEEPGRVVVMDGQWSTMLYKGTNYVHRVGDRGPERYWNECMVELDAVMNREAKQAVEQPGEFSLRRESGDDGREKTVIAVEALSKVPETDYLRNAYIDDSNHLKIYRFDAQTKLLEDVEVYVHDAGRDVLVFRLVQAEYNIELDPGLFVLQLPDNPIISEPLATLPDNEKYEKMTPKEAAIAFFTACAKEDWDEAVKFMGQTDVEQSFKDMMGGLEIIEIGEPFQSAGYVGWFVPYKLKMKAGYIKTLNLALRKDNPANRFEYDGGI